MAEAEHMIARIMKTVRRKFLECVAAIQVFEEAPNRILAGDGSGQWHPGRIAYTIPGDRVRAVIEDCVDPPFEESVVEHLNQFDISLHSILLRHATPRPDRDL